MADWFMQDLWSISQIPILHAVCQADKPQILMKCLFLGECDRIKKSTKNKVAKEKGSGGHQVVMGLMGGIPFGRGWNGNLVMGRSWCCPHPGKNFLDGGTSLWKDPL